MNQSASPILHRTKKPRSLLSSVGIALLATIIFLPCASFLFTCFAYRSEDPGALIPTFAYASALLSALFCGFFAARMRGRQGLFCGLLSGVGMMVLFLVALFVFAGDGELDTGKILFTDLPVFVLTVLGGVIGGMKRTPKRRRRR